MPDTALAAALRRDRAIVAAALIAITALALGYTYWLATGFDMSGMMSPAFIPWTAAHFAFMFMMWVVMMIGMMTPTVAPTILLYASFAKHNAARASFAPPAWFLAGYLLAWTAFAALATSMQLLLEWRAVVSPMMAGTGRVSGGAALIAAGVYQWLPLKRACLSACQSPLSFVQRHGGFQTTVRGSLRLGWRHGLYCVGCCWAAMLLLFAFGVMNLAWIAGLMVFVLLEKLAPRSPWLSSIAGIAAVMCGSMMLIAR
jgi:predicted metal-binding membrane protein